VLVLGSLTAIGPLSMTLYLPALPQLAADLNGTDAMAQLTISSLVVGMAAGQLLTGPVSDRFGRRRPLLIGLGAYAISSLLCALAPNMTLLICVRLVQGLAGGAAIVIARTIVRDLFETDAVARVFSLLMLVTGVAPVAAPVLGGQLMRVTTWPGLFVALGVIGVLILAAATWGIEETLPPSARGAGGFAVAGRQFTVVLRDRRFVGFTCVLTLGTTAMFVYLSMSPFVLQREHGLSAEAFSFVFAATAVGFVAAGQCSAWLVGRRGATSTLRVGLVATFVASCAFLVAVRLDLGLPVVLPLLMVAVWGVALILPTSNALALDAHRSRAGTASGVMGLVQFGGSGTIVPLVALGGTHSALMASTMVVAVSLALLIALTFARDDRRVLRKQRGRRSDQQPDAGERGCPRAGRAQGFAGQDEDALRGSAGLRPEPARDER
jgi:DHA1 family bicyclomycin/chloramphenicol resistance-like MFS transporter